MLRLRIIFFAIGLLVAGSAHSEETRDGRAVYEPLVHPIVGGSSDIGFVIGVAGALSRLAPGCAPFCWKLDATVSFSIKPERDIVTSPVHFYDLRGDIPGLAHGRLRLQPHVQVKRLVAAGYYGLGNASELEGAADEVPLHRYRYGQIHVSAGLAARLVLSGPLYARIAGRYAYIAPEVYDDSVLLRELEDGQALIRGVEPHSRPSVELGLGYDSRDDEVNPQRGGYHFITAKLTPGVPVSYGELSTGMRMFHPFIGEKLVGAGALRARFLSSGAPFDELALGHLRGVPGGRYHGKVQMAVNLELRSVFARFSVRRQRFGLGAVVFVDGGRVWADYRVDRALDGRGPGVHLGSGGGLRVQWGQTRMLRFDAAYSAEQMEFNPQRPLSWYLRVNQFF